MAVLNQSSLSERVALPDCEKPEASYLRFMRNLLELPADLPVPEDDGACAHLEGMTVPAIPLESTSGSLVNLAETRGRTVVYCYPGRGDLTSLLRKTGMSSQAHAVVRRNPARSETIIGS